MNKIDAWVKAQMIRVRKHSNRCDLCGAQTRLEHHHIVNRHSTFGSQEAAFLANMPQLGALLCRECHAKADTEEVERILFELNMRLWGRKAVLELLRTIRRYQPNIRFCLPEGEEL